MNKKLWPVWIALALYALRRVGESVVTAVGSRQQFVAEMGPILRRIEQDFGIKPKVGILQAAHESNWGRSALALPPNNNLFGLIGTAWADLRQIPSPDGKAPPRWEWVAKAGRQIVVFPTWEDEKNFSTKGLPEELILKRAGGQVQVRRPFRRYASKYESMRDWANLISTSSRYTKALAAARAGDVDAFAREIGASGYATDSSYGAKIARVAQDPLLATV